MTTQPSPLTVTERDNTITPRQLREAGYIPATLYGKKQEALSVQVRAHELNLLLLHGVREFQLTGFVEGKVKAQHVQREPVSQKPISLQLHLV